MKKLILVLFIVLVGCAKEKPSLNDFLDTCRSEPVVVSDADGNRNAAKLALKRMAWTKKADWVKITIEIPPHFMANGVYNRGYTINANLYFCDGRRYK